MGNKKLLELLENYLTGEKEPLIDYLNEKDIKISKKDYKKLSLVLARQWIFDYIPCYNFETVINNIDNEDFMNDEDNYML